MLTSRSLSLMRVRLSVAPWWAARNAVRRRACACHRNTRRGRRSEGRRSLQGIPARTRWGAPPAPSSARSLEGGFSRCTAWDQSPICHQTIVRGTATFCARSLRSRLFLWFRIGNPIARLAFRWGRPVVPRRTARPAINICPALGAGGGSGCCGDLVVCHIDARLVVAASG